MNRIKERKVTKEAKRKGSFGIKEGVREKEIRGERDPVIEKI